MKKEFTSEIHTHNKHLTTQDYRSISECLQRGLNLTDTAKYIRQFYRIIKFDDLYFGTYPSQKDGSFFTCQI